MKKVKLGVALVFLAAPCAGCFTPDRDGPGVPHVGQSIVYGSSGARSAATTIADVSLAGGNVWVQFEGERAWYNTSHWKYWWPKEDAPKVGQGVGRGK